MDIAQLVKTSWDTTWNVFVKRRPFIFVLNSTLRCNLQCECCFRLYGKQQHTDEMGTEDFVLLFERLKRSGIRVAAFLGGEPTLRDDISLLLEVAKKSNMRTVMCTNCFILPQKIHEIGPHLDILLCSLDGYGDVHDQFRGKKGVFDTVLRSIEMAKEFTHCDIKIWARLHKKNCHQVEELVQLAKRLQIKIQFFPLLVDSKNKKYLEMTPEETEEVYDTIISFKKKGFPIDHEYGHLVSIRDHEPFVCNYGRTSLFMGPRGEIHTCRGIKDHDLCSYKEFVPDTLYRSEKYKQKIKRLKGCNACRQPTVMEFSGNLGIALLKKALYHMRDTS